MRLAESVQDKMRRIIERDMRVTFGVPEPATTNAVATAGTTTLDAKTFFRDVHRFIIMEARQHRITFRVDDAHEGDMLKIEPPNEGTIFEMNFRQALRVHQEWPMKLHRIIDKHSAEFVPASQFDMFVPAHLPLPPFDVSEPESFEEWLNRP